ncbi:MULTISPECIES: response regulator transcription factor [unclassified Undibacterium]|uniref:response regulator n=1 Tax=unclassified Undibacterium TaxID=2630295 RepID=UPI002AC99948|nr:MULTISPECIES: response regulator transcription factor [unclassified Undibacterium]MEB0139352.1 response regulator transcription factor [Undibacterium sp. CCC2.1]MEB0172196.1 response regulator transcription factor [Undibacterium sp. CCC1.1]MEB0176014.1 response regulator transcription factor [Undibacterium sp. CCC3.4]MEB0215326.1 response regulator transcription factor [Undibacterium sp. 5I2]WPX43402.1 response regulator transcription factor [Undibacterium sp. CCC3.4]
MNLFIVEDSVLIQNRLIRFVEEIPGIHVIGVAADVTTAYDRVIHSNTDAMLLDLQLGEGNGMQLLKDIKHSKPEVKVLILTNHSNAENRLHALRAGADSFLDKSTDFAMIPAVLHRWQAPITLNTIN